MNLCKVFLLEKNSKKMKRSRKKVNLQKEVKEANNLVNQCLDTLKAEIHNRESRLFTNDHQFLFDERIFSFKIKIEKYFFDEDDSNSLKKNLNLKMSCLFLEVVLDELNAFLEEITKNKSYGKSKSKFTFKRLIYLSGKLDFPLELYQSFLKEPSNNIFCLHYNTKQWNNLREASEIIYNKSEKKVKKDYIKTCRKICQFFVHTAKFVKVLPKKLDNRHFLKQTVGQMFVDMRLSNDGINVEYPKLSYCFIIKFLFDNHFSQKSYETIWDDWYLLQQQRDIDVYFLFFFS